MRERDRRAFPSAREFALRGQRGAVRTRPSRIDPQHRGQSRRRVRGRGRSPSDSDQREHAMSIPRVLLRTDWRPRMEARLQLGGIRCRSRLAYPWSTRPCHRRPPLGDNDRRCHRGKGDSGARQMASMQHRDCESMIYAGWSSGRRRWRPQAATAPRVSRRPRPPYTRKRSVMTSWRPTSRGVSRSRSLCAPAEESNLPLCSQTKPVRENNSVPAGGTPAADPHRPPKNDPRTRVGVS